MSRRRRWLGLTIAGVVLSLGGGVFVITQLVPSAAPPSPRCQVVVDRITYTLSLEQAANATTIAAVGKRLGMPDHAVTVALATALTESGLRNLAYGDRDSLGLFQQRPSQGWGTPAQVMTPDYAATAFFEHLAQVEGWESLPVTVAAQHVQRSGAPTAYAAWEGEARALAIAMTGEVPAGLTCRGSDAGAGVTASLQQTMARELGAPTLGIALSSARGWSVATWLVGHASQFRLASVTFAGQMWTSSTGKWQPHSPAGTSVGISQY